MKKIRNILICGLGAIGGYYASVIENHSSFNLKILVDKVRLNKYQAEPRIINGKIYNFDYITPDYDNFKADLIIIATKSSGLESAIKNIKNFVDNSTIILSFLNGISSEKRIAKYYGEDKVLYSFLLGHTFFRSDKNITHDGQATIYFGHPQLNQKIEQVKNCFEELNISYNIPTDILNSMWNKFCFNCCANQISAITRMTFGEMINSKKCKELIKNICNEVSIIAKKEGIQDTDKFFENTLNSFKLMIPDGKTSMLQDIEAGIKPETDIFGKTIVSMGGKYSISTPYNKVISDIIELL